MFTFSNFHDTDTYEAAIASAKVTLSGAYFLAQHTERMQQPHGAFALGYVTEVTATSVPSADQEPRRPPGHHAQRALCGGYCFLNNAAIAAKYFLTHAGMRKIAIVDVDYHHGNGSKDSAARLAYSPHDSDDVLVRLSSANLLLGPAGALRLAAR